MSVVIYLAARPFSGSVNWSRLLRRLLDGTHFANERMKRQALSLAELDSGRVGEKSHGTVVVIADKRQGTVILMWCVLHVSPGPGIIGEVADCHDEETLDDPESADAMSLGLGPASPPCPNGGCHGNDDDATGVDGAEERKDPSRDGLRWVDKVNVEEP